MKTMGFKKLVDKLATCDIPIERENLLQLRNVNWMLENLHQRHPERDDMDSIQRALVEIKTKIENNPTLWE